jgi:CheY-like chemotaxis protein
VYDTATTPWLPDLSGLEVLVIEDDEDARNILIDVLHFAGATVNACADAHTALRSLDGQIRPHVIICDLALPRMDGMTFMYVLRSHRNPDIRRTPVIAVTAYGEIYGPTQLVKMGCEAYMMKPLDLDRLCRAVEKLAARRPRAAAPRKAPHRDLAAPLRRLRASFRRSRRRSA